MMKETEEMRQARHDLQLLSASDPAACANMLRHVAAYSLMLTGRRGRDRRENEPQMGGGFVLTHGDHNLCAAAARRSGTDYIYLAFDVDDALAPPVAAGVFRQHGEDMVVFGNCRLWSPANDGRALLVPQGKGDYVRRADTRLARLLASEALRDVHREGYMHRIHNVGQEIYADTRRAAA